MEKIAADIYSFQKLRENGFTYVDVRIDDGGGENGVMVLEDMEKAR